MTTILDRYNNFRCPICLQLLDSTVITPCFHRFCKECLRKSLLLKKECPKCRYRIGCLRQAHADEMIDEVIQFRWPNRDDFERQVDLVSGGGEAANQQRDLNQPGVSNQEAVFAVPDPPNTRKSGKSRKQSGPKQTGANQPEIQASTSTAVLPPAIQPPENFLKVAISPVVPELAASDDPKWLDPGFIELPPSTTVEHIANLLLEFYATDQHDQQQTYEPNPPWTFPFALFARIGEHEFDPLEATKTLANIISTDLWRPENENHGEVPYDLMIYYAFDTKPPPPKK